jgi:hypothetical protein
VVPTVPTIATVPTVTPVHEEPKDAESLKSQISDLRVENIELKSRLEKMNAALEKLVKD